MVSLHTDQELWTDAVINGAVSDHIDEQSRHPKALNTGINDEKAFDTSSRKGKQADDAGEDSSIETAVKPRKKRKKRKPKGQRVGCDLESFHILLLTLGCFRKGRASKKIMLTLHSRHSIMRRRKACTTC